MSCTLRETIDSLPDSWEEIRDLFVAHNIKGIRFIAGHCPLANYFRSQLNNVTVHVIDNIAGYHDYKQGKFVREQLSPACIEFYTKFDDDQIPELKE